MADFLKLTKNGFKLLELNPDRAADYKPKMDGNKFVIKDKDSNIIESFDTSWERDNWFYDEKPIQDFITNLRDNFQIDEDVTLGDLILSLEDIDEARCFLETLYPDYRTLIPEELDDPAELMVLRQTGNIDFNNCFVNCFEPGYSNNKNFCFKTQLAVDYTYILYDGNKEIGRGLHLLTLYDFLQYIFQKTSKTVLLTRQGLIDFDIKSETPLRHLNDICDIAEDVTLLDIFNFVGQNESLLNFISKYSWCRSINDFHEQALLPKEDNSDPDLWHLEIYRSCLSIYASKKFDNLRAYTYFNSNFHGIGDISENDLISYNNSVEKNALAIKEAELSNNNELLEQLREKEIILKENYPDYTNYSVSLIPMNHIANLPVQCKNTFNVMKFNLINGLQGNLISNKVYNTKYTLLDILDSIYWDISFYGGPYDNRENLKSEIENILDIEEF